MSAPARQPLDADAFAQLMAPLGPFERPPTVAVAVSGGRDSLALALLAQRWAVARGGAVVGLIVDHGLRPASAGEAAQAAATLEALGCRQEILCWTGAKPASGVQAAARAARYALLREACGRRGILHLLLAHHADDQAETVAMRAARQSGGDGLAGMAAVVELPEVRLLRPLLAVGRARLTATLEANGIAWLDDPSNLDPRFERARLRLAGAPGGVPAPSATIRADRERALATAAVASLADREDGIVIDPTAFAGLEEGVRTRLLSRVVQSVGGRDHPPRRDRLARAATRLGAAGPRGKSGRGQDFTLSACRLELRQGAGGGPPGWIVRPEHGRRFAGTGAQPLIPAAYFACGASAASHLE
ncbi:tRNA lysidine(34) synthetase TilS [Reyranella sp.]|uniref:tRNA lysidine(34) synthetase TilS n=1 Tax=Reyranella sp. TaxID=1929291 RepID=UPI003BA8BD0A